MIPCFDKDNILMEFKRGRGETQFDLTDLAELIWTNGDPPKFYGFGLGFSIKTSNPFVKAEKSLSAKADGIKLYHTVLSELLLTHLTNLDA